MSSLFVSPNSTRAVATKSLGELVSPLLLLLGDDEIGEEEMDAVRSRLKGDERGRMKPSSFLAPGEPREAGSSFILLVVGVLVLDTVLYLTGVLQL